MTKPKSIYVIKGPGQRNYAHASFTRETGKKLLAYLVDSIDLNPNNHRVVRVRVTSQLVVRAAWSELALIQEAGEEERTALVRALADSLWDFR